MTEKFFSIVIPVYNVEKYLNQCVDSVLAQSFGDFELLLVDDGSKDSSPRICDDYAKKDSRIRVIHKENGGASDARNYGIRAAEGTYLMFLDSDDYWDNTEALRIIHEAIVTDNAAPDVVMFQAKLLYPDGSMIPDSYVYPEGFNDLSPAQALETMTRNGSLVGSACSKAVKRTFLLGNGLLFKVGTKCEDIDWIIRLANCLPSYRYCDLHFYIYRKGRSESVTGSMDCAHLNQWADMLEGFSGDFAYAAEATARCLRSFVAYEFSILMASAANLEKCEDKKRLIRRIKNFRRILRYDMHPKVRKINLVCKVVGFDLVMLLLGIYLKYRKR